MTNNSRRVRSNPVRSTAVRVAALMALGVAAAAPAARAQALKQVPPDALVVVKINHLDETNTKVAALLQTLGAVDLKPEAKDPLKLFEDATGIPAAAVDAKRDAALYMPNAPGPMDGEAPPVVLLLPVSDYQAFVGGLTGAKTEGEVTTGKFKGDDNDTFVAHWGDYAAVSPRKEFVTAPHAGLEATGAAARELDQKDVCAFVNFPALKQLLLPKLGEARTKAATEMDRHMESADAAKKDLAHAALGQAFNVVDRFLQDAEPTTFGLSLGKAGITSTMVVAFKHDSYLGDMFGGMKTTGEPLLAGLPDEKYLFFGGSVQDPKMVTKLIDDVLGPVTAKLGALGENGTKALAMVDLYKSALASSDGGSAGMVVPTAALGQGSLIRYVAVLRADAQKLKDAQEQMSEMQGGLMAGFGIQGADLMKTTVTKNVKTVDGCSFDQIKSEVDPNANNGQAAQASEMMKYMYGPDGVSVLLGAVNDHTLVSVVGSDDQLLGGVVAAAKGNKDVLTAQVKAVDAELPKTRAVVAYFDLAQFFTTGLSYAHAVGMNVGVQLPPNLPPVGLSLGTDPDAAALREDVFVPTSLLQSLVQAGFQLYLQVPHGGGGGGL